MQIDPRILKAKSKRIIEDADEILRYIVEEETKKVMKETISAESEFDLAKKHYQREGIKEGLKRFVQALNELASRNI